MDRESMTNEENYFFDNEGYIVIPGVLTQKEIDTLNSTLDEAGTTDNLLALSAPVRDPIRDLLVHPVLVWFLNQICGPGFRLDKAPRLVGEAAGDGGFVCVPGTHKSYYPMSEGIRTSDDDMGMIHQPVLKAGDILFFMDTALTHGAGAWKSDIGRRSIFFTYQSRHHTWSGSIIEPEDRWGEDIVEGMTEAQFAVMRGPNRDVRNKNTSRLVVENGQMSVSYDGQGDPYEHPVRKPGDKREG